MSTITFDTLKYVKQLEASGIPSAQAEAFVNAQREILSEALDASMATKADMLRTENRIALLDAKVDSKFVLLQWMLTAVLALVIAIFVKQYF
ncbi:MAG: DUF1640 domain-containing protein [Rhodoferax sp.]|jgi:hypothetical protein|nr:DUF1640 domain-containing protein [Rhodoferax sp.]